MCIFNALLFFRSFGRVGSVGRLVVTDEDEREMFVKFEEEKYSYDENGMKLQVNCGQQQRRSVSIICAIIINGR